MRLILPFLMMFLFAEDFITDEEYGKMLYTNPRGIGCIKCHSKNATGKVIAVYKDKQSNNVSLIAPNIKKVSWKDFYIRVKYSKIFKDGEYKKINYSAMPRYDYLTDKEIVTIYNYIHRKGE